MHNEYVMIRNLGQNVQQNNFAILLRALPKIITFAYFLTKACW